MTSYYDSVNLRCVRLVTFYYADPSKFLKIISELELRGSQLHAFFSSVHALQVLSSLTTKAAFGRGDFQFLYYRAIDYGVVEHPSDGYSRRSILTLIWCLQNRARYLKINSNDSRLRPVLVPSSAAIAEGQENRYDPAHMRPRNSVAIRFPVAIQTRYNSKYGS